MTEIGAGDRWRRQLSEWAIPAEILAQAPTSPWILPAACFTPRENPPNDSTTRRCLDLLRGRAPTVLDVGCGAGRASLHLVPPAVSVAGVDEKKGLLEQFSREAAIRGVPVTTTLGEWLSVADDTPVADLVVCAQVLYNVPEIERFLGAPDDHARVGVVIELDTTHPLSKLDGAWRHFWGLDRPSGPTVTDLLDVLAGLGIEPKVDVVDLPDHKTVIGADDVERTRQRLCLTEDRDPDVRQFLEAEERPGRRLATIWWER